MIFLRIEKIKILRIAVANAFKRPGHGPIQTTMQYFYRLKDSPLASSLATK